MKRDLAGVGGEWRMKARDRGSREGWWRQHGNRISDRWRSDLLNQRQ